MPFPHPLRSLAQIPDLAPLLAICRELDVEITAFGSLVRRLARHLLSTPAELPDLFQLAPFLSDIDLRHSGTPAQTEEVRQAILGRVPFSECFRWQIFSEEELREFTDDEAHRPVIPANKLRLGTRGGRGIEDPFQAARDFRTGRFRLLRSPFYDWSTLRRTHRDAELLYALEYFKVLCEESSLRLDEQPGLPVAREIVDEARTPALLGALEESAYLRAKFRYRSQALRSSCRNVELWQAVVGPAGLGPALEYVLTGLPFPVLDFGTSSEKEGSDLEEPIVSSCRLIGDRFRLQVPPLAEASYERAGEAWAKMRRRRKLGALSAAPLPHLPPGQRIIADTPEFRFHPGKAPSAMGDEHIHFQLTLPEDCARHCRDQGEAGLAAFVVLTAEERSSEDLLSLAAPISAVCWLVEARNGDEVQTRLQIRANCGRLLEALPDLLWQTHPKSIASYRVKLFVVARS